MTAPEHASARTRDLPLAGRRGLGEALHSRVHISRAQLAVLFAILAALPLVRPVDPDFWWHLRTGDLIVHSGIPRNDPFSWTRAGESWVAHEWLSEAIIYVVQATLGYWANVALFAGAVIAALSVSYGLGRWEGAGTRALVLLTLLSTVVLSFYVTVRPQVLSWLLFVTFVALIQRRNEERRAPVWVLPPLMALWANLHLGFVYGLGAVGVWFLALVYERWRGRPADLRTAAMVVTACFAAVFLNPEGPRLLVYPVRYYFEGQVDRSLVYEWQRPNPLSFYDWPILAPAILLTLALVSRSRPGPFLSVMGGVAAALTVSAVRNAPFAALLLLPVVGSVAARRWSAFSRDRDSSLTAPLPVFAGAPIGAALIVVALNVSVGKPLSLAAPSDYHYPAAGVSYLRQHVPDARVFNEYSWGGYLDENLYPDGRVFIDGRADFFGPEILQDYASVWEVKAGWDSILDDYRVDAVLMPRGAPVSEALRRHPGWREVFSGPIESVFIRR